MPNNTKASIKQKRLKISNLFTSKAVIPLAKAQLQNTPKMNVALIYSAFTPE